MTPQHDTPCPGAPCRRCGLAFSSETAYVACREEGESQEAWLARQHEDVRALVGVHAPLVLGEVVRHRASLRVGSVTRVLDRGDRIEVDGVGPYPAADFSRLVDADDVAERTKKGWET